MTRSSPVTELEAVKQAIWQAHKDNFHARMIDIYPMMAVAAVEAMRAPAQCAPEELAREELAIARLRAAIAGEEFEWEIDGGSPFDDVQFLLRAYDRLAASAVTSTDSGGNNV